MAVVVDDKGTILGWVLIDLDEPAAKRLYHAAEKMGIHVEQLIDTALQEKADQLDSELALGDTAESD